MKIRDLGRKYNGQGDDAPPFNPVKTSLYSVLQIVCAKWLMKSSCLLCSFSET